MASLREALVRPGGFVVAAELVTSRGPITSEGGARVLALARDLAADPRIDVLSITDNPGGHAMLSPDALGTDLVSRGQEVIIHLACKDWNRNALESRGWQLSSGGFHNVLALSGDYPVVGHRGLAASVFDIDSVGAKNQRNGPCGGTRDGRCEVYDTECIWSEAYERLKAYGEEESMLDGPVVVKDNALQGTSAWTNTFPGRDHVARWSADSGLPKIERRTDTAHRR